MTERERLAALARAAGLRLSRQDIEALLPAWKRYLALVAALRVTVGPEPRADNGPRRAPRPKARVVTRAIEGVGARRPKT